MLKWRKAKVGWSAAAPSQQKWWQLYLCLFCCQSGIRGELYERLQANLQASRMTKLALAFIKLTVVLWDHGHRMPQYCIKCIFTQCKDRQQHCITFFFFYFINVSYWNFASFRNPIQTDYTNHLFFCQWSVASMSCKVEDWLLVDLKMATHKEDLISALESSLQVLWTSFICIYTSAVSYKYLKNCWDLYLLLGLCFSFSCHRQLGERWWDGWCE